MGRHEQYFSTDHLQRDLKGRAVRGGGITLATQITKSVVQLGSIAILARLLTPFDFGLIAMVLAVTGFAEMFKDAGLSMATVQREEITHEQVSTLFWINLSLSLVITLAVAGLAWVIAWFYQEPRLVRITMVLAGAFVFGGLTVQHQALLRRQMRFRELAIIDVLALAAGLGTGIGMALGGWGYWSLVGITIATAFANCVLVWTFNSWRPGLPSRNCGVRPMIGFGGRLTVASVFDHLRKVLPVIFIGQALGSAVLAIYERAYRLLVLPLSHMMPPISAVAIPTLSRMQGEPERFRRTARRLIILASALSVPASVIGLLAAPEIVEFMLGDQWRRSAVILAYLSPLGATQAVSSVAIWVLSATGKGTVLMRFGVINALLAAASIWIGLRYGLEGAALAFSLVGVLVRTPMLYAFVIRHSCLGWMDVIGRAGIFVASGVMIAASGLGIRYGWMGLNEPSYWWLAGTVGAVGLLWLPVLWWCEIPGMVREVVAASGRGRQARGVE